MSYIPPFKRSSRDENRPSPKLESLGLELKKKIGPGITEKDLSEERLWELAAENILHNLLPAFENLKNSTEIDNLVKIKPKLVARLGKVHFRGRVNLCCSIGQDIIRKASIEESDMRKLKRIFHTDLSLSYNDNITRKFSSESEFISQDKKSFLIRLSDAEKPDNAIFCNCWEVAGSGRLQLGKIYLTTYGNWYSMFCA